MVSRRVGRFIARVVLVGLVFNVATSLLVADPVSESQSKNLIDLSREFFDLQESLGYKGDQEIEIDPIKLHDLVERAAVDIIDMYGETEQVVMLSNCLKRLKLGAKTLAVNELLLILPSLIDYVERSEGTTIFRAPRPGGVQKEMQHKPSPSSPAISILNHIKPANKPSPIVAPLEKDPDGDENRAPRPDAGSVFASDAIVGKNESDCAQVLWLISIIKKKVMEIIEDIEETQEIICDKFNQTWTILANLEITATTDLSEVFTAIDGLEEVVCNKFEETWTILANLEVTATVDFNPVFTVLDELCEKIDDGFGGTFTVLDGICDKLEDLVVSTTVEFGPVFTVLDEVCEKIGDGFGGTFTVLDEICEKLEDLVVSITVDFGPVFTAINGLEDLVCNKFEQTWTILEEIQEAAQGFEECCDAFLLICEGTFTTLDEICEKIDDGFGGTFTVLDEICDKLEDLVVSTTVDFGPVFTAIDELEEIVCDKFELTFSKLDILCETLCDCCELLEETIIDVCFELCCKIEEEASETRTLLCDKFEQTWTILNVISQAVGCDSSVGISEETMIIQPGTYCLLNDIVGTITIAADRVELNLNNYQISAIANALVIDQQTDITVGNGTIMNATAQGVMISSCTHIFMHDINFEGNVVGIEVENTACFNLENCSFREHTDCGIRASGLHASNFSKCTFKDNLFAVALDIVSSANINVDTFFVVENNMQRGIALDSCKHIVLDSSLINNNENNLQDGSVSGIFAQDSSFISIKNCQTNDNVAVSKAFGVHFLDTSTSCIRDSVAMNNNFGGTGSGFRIENTGLLGALTTALLSNKADNNGQNSTNDNYFVFPGVVPKASLSFSTGAIAHLGAGTFSSFDNLVFVS